MSVNHNSMSELCKQMERIEKKLDRILEIEFGVPNTHIENNIKCLIPCAKLKETDEYLLQNSLQVALPKH